MKTKSLSSAFTLLELVVVLAILAIVTAIAVRSLGGVEDQRRFDSNKELMDNIERAVLGSDGDDAQAVGFVADMGRLPRSVGNTGYTLAELWDPAADPSLASFDVRTSAIDTDVAIPTGWRGPYLRLGIGADRLRDAWGNLLESPAAANPPDPLGAGYARLRDASGDAINMPGQPIALVEHLGSNGIKNPADDAFERDGGLDFRGRIEAEVKASVEVVDKLDTPSIGSGTDKVIVRVFGPNPGDATLVQVLPAGNPSDFVSLSTSPVTVPSDSDAIVGATVGPRALRAYLYDANGILVAKSAVKRVTLRPGRNFLSFKIRRPDSP